LEDVANDDMYGATGVIGCDAHVYDNHSTRGRYFIGTGILPGPTIWGLSVISAVYQNTTYSFYGDTTDFDNLEVTLTVMNAFSVTVFSTECSLINSGLADVCVNDCGGDCNTGEFHCSGFPIAQLTVGHRIYVEVSHMMSSTEVKLFKVMVQTEDDSTQPIPGSFALVSPLVAGVCPGELAGLPPMQSASQSQSSSDRLQSMSSSQSRSASESVSECYGTTPFEQFSGEGLGQTTVSIPGPCPSGGAIGNYGSNHNELGVVATAPAVPGLLFGVNVNTSLATNNRFTWTIYSPNANLMSADVTFSMTYRPRDCMGSVETTLVCTSVTPANDYTMCGPNVECFFDPLCPTLSFRCNFISLAMGFFTTLEEGDQVIVDIVGTNSSHPLWLIGLEFDDGSTVPMNVGACGVDLMDTQPNPTGCTLSQSQSPSVSQSRSRSASQSPSAAETASQSASMSRSRSPSVPETKSNSRSQSSSDRLQSLSQSRSHSTSHRILVGYIDHPAAVRADGEKRYIAIQG
jgi:hypothetical protein